MYAQMSNVMPFQHGFTNGLNCLDMTLWKAHESSQNWTHKLCLRRDKMLLCVFSNNTMAEIKNLVKSSLSMTGCAGVRFFTINLYFISVYVCLWTLWWDYYFVWIQSQTSKVYNWVNLTFTTKRIKENRAATNDDFHCQLICWLFYQFICSCFVFNLKTYMSLS